jgi:hypothetical protein
VIAVEVRRHGRCTLTIPHIAALAGVGRSTVKRALGEAHTLGVIRIQERRLTAFRNASNVVSVVDPAWSAWLRLRRAGVGSISRPAAQYKKEQGAPIGAKGCRERGVGGWNGAQKPYGGRTGPSSNGPVRRSYGA